MLSSDLRAKAEEIKARYPDARSALMPLLYLVQSEEGYLTQEGMAEVGDLLGLTTAEVQAVASFYTMLRHHPTGRYVISVCTNLSCALLGAKRVYERAHEVLDPNSEGITDDGEFTLHEEECLGACDEAPVVQVNFVNYDRVDEDGVVRLIDAIKRGDVPAPPRGQSPVDFKATSLRLAGLDGPDG